MAYLDTCSVDSIALYKPDGSLLWAGPKDYLMGALETGAIDYEGED